ncbi:MAG: ATP-binding protein [Patescibacteria group bacterium]
MNTKEIKQILIDQREELETFLEDKKIIKREVLENYTNLLKSSLIKIIIGPRRSGKSVLSFQLLKNKNFAYVNFDDERLSTLETQDLNLILQTIYEIHKKPEFIFFDEIQNISKWELFVNRLKRQKINLIVTGSNAKLLSAELATHLTGRHFSLELFPFSFREYLIFNEFLYFEKIFSTKEIALIKKYLNDYLHFGGFPEVVQGENYKRYLVALYSTILTKDIILRHKVKYINVLKEVANYLICNFANKITFNKLKNIFSLKSVHTVQNYFSFIEETYLIFAVKKFSYKFKERLTAPRKIYSIDTGLINAISTKFSQEIGHIYENAVAIELLRKKSFNEATEIYYWEDVYGREVDFVVKQDLKIKQLIQVCYNIENYDTKQREIKSLIKASNELKCSNLLVITDDYEGEEKIKGKKIKFVSLWKWLIE